MDPIQAVTEMNTAWKELKSTFETERAEVKEHGRALGETVAKIELLQKTLDSEAKRLNEIETKLARPRVEAAIEGAKEANPTFKAFGSYLRKGREGLSPEEAKALSVGDDTTAGYLAPTEYLREIVKASLLFSPVRQFARVIQTSAKDVELPKRTAQFAASWVAETGTKSETTGLTYGLWKIPNHELHARVDVSNPMLEDSAFNLESELAMEFSEQFGIAEGTAFVTGTGVGKPQGFIEGGLSSTNSGDADLLTSDGIYDLVYAVKTPYHAGAIFGAAASTIGAIRKLKDGNGQYLWEPALALGQPSTLLGRPVVEMTDMAAVAASAKPIVFGDFRRGYAIVDRIGMSILRDPYSAASTNQVRFYARKRVGGQVILAEALRLQNISA